MRIARFVIDQTSNGNGYHHPPPAPVPEPVHEDAAEA
jgi:hypothetical protein